MINFALTGIHGMAIFAASTLLAGCIIVPVPEHGTLGGRLSLAENDTLFIQPGRTTRDEVLLRLGFPERRVDDQRTFVYWWETVMAYVLAEGTTALGRNNVLLIEFDHTNTVVRFEFASADLFESRDGPVNTFLSQ